MFVHLLFGAVCDLKTCLLMAVDVIATVSWFCVITRGRWLRVYIIHVEILSISVIYSVRFLLFMRYCQKALETNVIYNSAERYYLLINEHSRWVVSKKKAPGLSLSKSLSDYPRATKFLACKECLQDADGQQWAREYCEGKPDS